MCVTLVMHLGTNDRWTDTNVESLHRLSVPIGLVESLFVVVSSHSQANRPQRKTSQLAAHIMQTILRILQTTRQTTLWWVFWWGGGRAAPGERRLRKVHVVHMFCKPR